VAVQVQKQQRPAVRLGASIELFSQQVKLIRVIEFIGEKRAGIAHEVIRAQLNDVIQVDKIAIDVGENVGVVIRIQKDGSRTHEGLD
jgi:hypothetical protein